MTKFRLTFQGRTVGACGIMQSFAVELEAETAEAAVLKLYDTHEHIMRMQIAVERYVVTHIGVDGTRTLAHARQGRCTYETAAAAQAWIQAAKEQNGLERLATFYGLPLEVRPCWCYPVHFDPINCWFTEPKIVKE